MPDSGSSRVRSASFGLVAVVLQFLFGDVSHRGQPSQHRGALLSRGIRLAGAMCDMPTGPTVPSAWKGTSGARLHAAHLFDLPKCPICRADRVDSAEVACNSAARQPPGADRGLLVCSPTHKLQVWV